MHTSAELLFTIALTCLIAHELDAIRQHEWRYFPVLNRLPDDTACAVFIALHVPLLIMILWNMPERGFQIGMSAFIIFHAVLHFLLRHDPRLTFNSALSRLWIFGAVPFSIGHLILIGQA